jgi:2-polyprenyl-3-methyl-5-hydroxy-6-metoxy-1,4-benzoquinol methylase
MTHYIHLTKILPTTVTDPWLDIGSGEGAFAIEAALAGHAISALEYYDGHIDIASKRATEAKAPVIFTQGVGEALPYEESRFGFVNLSEVVEHVQDPEQVLKEAFRVLVPGGYSYISVPNRFGLRDQHYHMYFINWVPRSWTDALIALRNRHKPTEDFYKGRQRLSDMHYYTYGAITRILRGIGFTIQDIREVRIQKETHPLLRPFVLLVYKLLRPWYFDSFHLLVQKPPTTHAS